MDPKTQDAAHCRLFPPPTTALGLLRPALAPLWPATSLFCPWYGERKDEAGGEGAGTRPRPPPPAPLEPATVVWPRPTVMVVWPSHPGMPCPPPAPGIGQHRLYPGPPRGATHVPPVPSIERWKRDQYCPVTGGNFRKCVPTCMRYASVRCLEFFENPWKDARKFWRRDWVPKRNRYW